MNTVHKIETWGNMHHPMVLDPIRIVLGIFLIFKGASFINDTYTLHAFIANQTVITIPDSALMAIIYVVTFAHLIGGAMIALGVATRIASLIQMPILIGAVIISNSLPIPDSNSLWVSVAVLALLTMFSVIGSGRLSIEKIMEGQKTIFS